MSNNVSIVRGDAPDTFNIIGLPFDPSMAKPTANGKGLVANVKLNVTDSDLSFVDGEGKAYPLALSSYASLRLPFVTLEDLAAEIIDEEVTGRKNAARQAEGKKALLSKSAKRRNRRKTAVAKWQAEQRDNPFANIVFSELLDDARREYVEENSQQRVERKAKQLAKRYEENRLSVAECESLLVGLNLMLATLPENTDAWLAVKAQHEQYTAKLEAAQSGKRDAQKAVVANVDAQASTDAGKDIAGAALIADTDLADAMAAE